LEILDKNFGYRGDSGSKPNKKKRRRYNLFPGARESYSHCREGLDSEIFLYLKKR